MISNEPDPLAEDLIIRVTEGHIATGERKAYSTCPIALAVKEKINCYCEINAYNGAARVVVEVGPGENENCFWQELPGEAYEFVRAFDDGLPVQPIALVLRQAYWSPCEG